MEIPSRDEAPRLRCLLRLQILGKGGFTELQRFGSWQHGPSPAEYVERVRHYSAEIGNLVAVGPQDWMCEKEIITGGRFGHISYAGTHLSVRRHQHLTTTGNTGVFELLEFLPVDRRGCMAALASRIGGDR
ncbi:DUF7221 family queuine tRNA-ribosyltransferase-like protein [Nocardia gipuzkoensis]|uniref:deazapurine DNA modification protein DpdA family protein n=1 Tax=Nocardia gipuzkoensis TaxID=2749991 RepID=UPI003EE36E95